MDFHITRLEKTLHRSRYGGEFQGHRQYNLDLGISQSLAISRAWQRLILVRNTGYNEIETVEL